MNLRCTSVGVVALALHVLGCSASDNEAADFGSGLCVAGEISACACTDGSMSQQVCNATGAFDPCMCGTATGAGGGTPIGSGGFVSSGGFVGSGGAVIGAGGAVIGAGGTVIGAGGTVIGAGGFIGTGGDIGAGGIIGAGGFVGTGGDIGAGGAPIMTSQDPQIPPVAGNCPTFANQTLNFMSLNGINMSVGPRSNGTGVLLFYWHGTGSSAGEVGLIGAGRQRILDTGGVIISPQSSTGSTAGLQASGTSIWFAEDLTTADQIAACAVRDYGIDPRRIYATGCSAGGLMSGYMAAQRWQYIAAVAPNSGGGLGQNFAGAQHIPQVMTMHGAAGRDVVVIDFAQQSLAFTAAVVAAGGFAIDCDHGGSHCGAPGDLYAAAITFLLDHPFGVSPEPYASALPGGFPSYCRIQ